MYKNLKSEANSVVSLDFLGFRPVLSLIGFFKEKKFDAVIELHQRGSSSKVLRLFSIIFKYKYFFHNHNLLENKDSFVLDQGKTKASIQRDLDCIWSVLRFYLKDRVGILPSYLEHAPQLSLNKDLKRASGIILGVVATRKTKMWPLEYYKRLVDLILKRHPNIAITIPVSKGIEDQLIKARLASLRIDRRVEFIEESLENLPAALAGHNLYIGNDTGLKHLSAALGINTYTFFGPEDPLEWHPYHEDFHKYFFIENLSCRTETAHFCGKSICKNMICLDQFVPEEVFKKIEKDIF